LIKTGLKLSLIFRSGIGTRIFFEEIGVRLGTKIV
jgi:hypothetical protein